MVILEAMACGCPVMSTPTPGALDIIVDDINGMILKDKNPYDIANRINRLLHNKEKLLKIGEEAQKTVQRKFTWPIIALQYYKYVLQKK
jgi:glycosyltransferase involved in cell wall biosynthesis